MPKIEDLERLGSVALLIGNKKLPEELSKNDYDAFKSVFTNEYMENSKPTEDNDLPLIDEIDNLLSNDEDNIIKDNDIDDLGLPNDLGLEEDDKILSNLDDLGLPDNLGEEKEDEKISSDINDLNLEENNLEESDSNKLPILDDLPLPDNLSDTKNNNNTNDKNISNDLGISDISHLSDLGDFDNNVIEETLEENDNDIEENDFNEDNENLEEILDEVRNSAYKIIEKKGSTYYGVAMAVKRIAQAIIRDEYSILPVSHFLNGEYGINDVCLGIPSLICREGVKKIIPITLNEEEKNYLTKSANKLKEAYRSIKK